MMWNLFVKNECRACEILQIELDHARREKQLLMEALIERVKPIAHVGPESEVKEQDELKPIRLGKQYIPHKVRNQMIRENDLQLLEVMKKSKQEMAEARLAQIERVEGEPDLKVEEMERDIFGAK